MIEDPLAAYPSQIIQRTIYLNEYDLYLHGEIGNPDKMMEHYSLYRQATENDLIRLWIISPGGSSATASQYFQHMLECKATIIGIPGCENASAATAIAMHCDDLQIGPFTTFMIHGVSYGYYGTAKRMALESDASLKFNKKFMELVYSSFLDESEIKHCLEGNDILLDSDEIQERWDNFKEARDAKGCMNPDCNECSGEPMPSIDSIISDAVAEGVEQALDKLLKKYTLTEKEKPKKAPRVKSLTEVLKDSKSSAAEIFKDIANESGTGSSVELDC